MLNFRQVIDEAFVQVESNESTLDYFGSIWATLSSYYHQLFEKHGVPTQAALESGDAGFFVNRLLELRDLANARKFEFPERKGLEKFSVVVNKLYTRYEMSLSATPSSSDSSAAVTTSSIAVPAAMFTSRSDTRPISTYTMWERCSLCRFDQDAMNRYKGLLSFLQGAINRSDREGSLQFEFFSYFKLCLEEMMLGRVDAAFPDGLKETTSFKEFFDGVTRAFQHGSRVSAEDNPVLQALARHPSADQLYQIINAHTLFAGKWEVINNIIMPIGQDLALLYCL